ncbi:hypothetical protein F53441_5572 [Fusarium austroafricanum]|uniref:Uncharacterized protein n=1 Tax=Fusarium austroafricanum TaxID=2364996 RepID=A0A8H4KHN1_9HYPO|nr:hypothetical protein F53441_5572 [Fusarium austroafricanum]
MSQKMAKRNTPPGVNDMSENQLSQAEIDQKSFRRKMNEKAQKERDETVKKKDQGKKAPVEDWSIQQQVGLLNHFWKDLRGCIQTLSQESFFTQFKWDDLDEATQQRFIGYSPLAKELFQIEEMPGFLFRRWIWDIIDQSFFTKKSKDIVWTSPYWAIEDGFAFRDYPQNHNYPHWRYSAFQFYYSTHYYHLALTPERVEKKCVTKILAQGLGQYFPKGLGSRCEYTLELITEKVVKYEFWWNCTVIDFRHVFHYPVTEETSGFAFSPDVEGIRKEAMEIIDGNDTDKGRSVDVVVAPVLAQYGSHLGFDYHVGEAVFPMQVCVAWLEDFKKGQENMTVDDKEGEEEKDDTEEDKEGERKKTKEQEE